jgi:glycosyltransferase involved in cell wall biosynthesis
MNEQQSIQKNNVLIVAYHFPPDAAVGALRPQKFAKYLPEFGWQPYVLTIKEQFIEKLDPQRLEDVQRSIITRTDFWRTPLQLFLDWRDKLRGKMKPNAAELASKASEILSNGKRKNPLWIKLKHLIFLINCCPDNKLFWLFPALWSGFRLIKRENISTIYTTVPPHSVANIGLLLSYLTGTKLVIDFRDPWVLFHRSFLKSSGERLLLSFESLCERLITKRAKAVISTTERLTNELRKQYCVEQRSKFVTIPNGFDTDDFADLENTPDSNGKIRICYLGTFYLDRNPESFFSALHNVIANGIISEDRIEVRLIGDVALACGQPTSQMIRHYNLEGCVTLLGVVPYREALQNMSRADLLLLLAPNQKYQIPAKAFEYIGVQRPILALTEDDSATADLIHSVNAGLVADQKDVDQIYKALKVFFLQANSSTSAWYNGEDVSMFSRKRLTGKLVEILSDL